MRVETIQVHQSSRILHDMIEVFKVPLYGIGFESFSNVLKLVFTKYEFKSFPFIFKRFRPMILIIWMTVMF